MPLYPKQFIEITFLNQYRSIVYDQGYHYIGFALVCIGIEFLGKCLDSQCTWHQENLSAAHFKNAIDRLMPAYAPYKSLLYKQLRSGFAHGLLPGADIGLTHRRESVEYGTKHLQKHGSAVTLVIEDFYDDFEKACRALLNMTFPSGDKMSNAVLAVPSDPSQPLTP